MPMHGKIGEFDPSQETWTMYADRLELYFVANRIKRCREEAGSASYRERRVDIPIDPQLVRST